MAWSGSSWSSQTCSSRSVLDLTHAWELSNLYPYYPTYVVRRRWRRVKETLRKVIDFKIKGLKLTCGARAWSVVTGQSFVRGTGGRQRPVKSKALWTRRNLDTRSGYPMSKGRRRGEKLLTMSLGRDKSRCEWRGNIPVARWCV